jgi:hypothetical protein
MAAVDAPLSVPLAATTGYELAARALLAGPDGETLCFGIQGARSAQLPASNSQLPKNPRE